MNTQVLELVESVHGGDCGNVREQLATLFWSYLAEPGDRDAVNAIRCFGAHGALIQVAGAKSGAEYIKAVAAGLSAANTLFGNDASFGGSEGGCETSSCETILRETSEWAVSAPAPQTLHAAYKRWTPRLQPEAFIASLRLAVKHKLRFLVASDSLWPGQVASLDNHAPLVLWGYGDLSLLRRSGVAVVGSRALSSYGKSVTADFAQTLTQLQVPVLSGGAYGIDAEAHRGALRNSGQTVAVMAGGIDKLYPVAHTDLFLEIADTGLLCSEMMPGSAPTRWRFLQRNRVLAALAAGVIVTEAGVRSGSMNTARHAMEMARPVGAVPGRIDSYESIGCNQLIREHGAELLCDADSVREFSGAAFRELAYTGLLPDLELGSADLAGVASDATVDESIGDVNHTRVQDAIPRRGSAPLEKIAVGAGLDIDTTRLILTELELLGLAELVTTKDTPHWRLPRV